MKLHLTRLFTVTVHHITIIMATIIYIPQGIIITDQDLIMALFHHQNHIDLDQKSQGHPDPIITTDTPQPQTDRITTVIGQMVMRVEEEDKNKMTRKHTSSYEIYKLDKHTY